jgi:hypothetical protein
LRLPPRAETTYRGSRAPDGSVRVTIEPTASADGEPQLHSAPRPLPLHLDVRNHSPTGFEWGYGGSGPAQLALALLLDATGDEAIALQHYQTYKRRVVAGWGASWTTTAAAIRSFVAEASTEAEPSPPPPFEVPST